MWLNIFLVIILVICTITDLRERLIYNKVIFPSLGIALICNLVIGGLSAVGTSIVGFLVGLAVLLIPYLIGGMGAGDVKLLALIGAIKGPIFVINTSIYMALAGSLLAIIFLLFRKGAFHRLKLIFYFLHGKRYGLKMPNLLNKQSFQGTYPYGVAIACGAVWNLLGKGWF